MNIVNAFQQKINAGNLFEKDAVLLLAVSGGIDSVVLCELCHQSGFSFVIAHCNFQLRGEESERDEQFVHSLGEKYNTAVLVGCFDTEEYAAQKKVSIQVAARELRYAWFDQLVEEGKTARYIVTAHHADDNAETVLMNFCRGTGLHGLTGIPAKSGRVVRPLLEFTKQELVDFAGDRQLAYVEDSSNQSSKYTRNLFRNEIMPLAEKVYPQLKKNLQDNIRRFTAIEALYRLSTDILIRKLCRVKGNELHIPIKQLLGYDNRALIYAVIAPYGFSEKQVEEVSRLAESDSGKYIVSPGGAYRIIRHRHWFIISSQADTAAENIIIDENDRRVDFANGSLYWEKVKKETAVPASPSVALLDCKGIAFPLLLRKWKAGDYFYPLGMPKKKKLARFFIDQKMSKSDKEKAWVIEAGGKIIWVVGMRIDERFKVTAKTSQMIRLTWLR